MSAPATPTQAAVIPFRRDGGAVRLCLITTSRSGRWGIPKGNIDPGETPEQTALKEVLEEAGLRGRLLPEPLGVYAYRKRGRSHTVLVFLMEVTGIETIWMEMSARERCWVTPEEAVDRLAGHPIVPLLPEALDRIESP